MNIPIKKEFLVLLMGPVVQCFFVLMIWILKVNVTQDFYDYHFFILGFNLLPIYPLDGGRLFQLIISYFFSYYHSLKWTLYVGYTLFIMLLITFFLFPFNFLVGIILVLLGIKVFQEVKKVDYYYHKFLMERYLKGYHFKKKKQIHNVKEIKRDFYHYQIQNNRIILEKDILIQYFSF